MVDRDRPDRHSRREILSDPKAISDYRRSTVDSFRETSRDLTRSSPDSLAATHAAQPSMSLVPRSMLDFARNDKCKQPCDRWVSILYLEGALSATELGGHYANDNCCSKKESCPSGAGRFFAA